MLAITRENPSMAPLTKNKYPESGRQIVQVGPSSESSHDGYGSTQFRVFPLRSLLVALSFELGHHILSQLHTPLLPGDHRFLGDGRQCGRDFFANR